jgi:hypothetical protein
VQRRLRSTDVKVLKLLAVFAVGAVQSGYADDEDDGDRRSTLAGTGGVSACRSRTSASRRI